MRKFTLLTCSLLLVACSSTPTWEGMSESEIAGWKDIGVTVEQVAPYVKAGLQSQQVQQWFDNNFTKGKEIIAWASAKFSPENAAGWKSSGFSLEDAIEWAQNKFSYSEAKEWREASFDLDDAVDHREKGLTPVK